MLFVFCSKCLFSKRNIFRRSGSSHCKWLILIFNFMEKKKKICLHLISHPMWDTSTVVDKGPAEMRRRQEFYGQILSPLTSCFSPTSVFILESCPDWFLGHFIIESKVQHTLNNEIVAGKLQKKLNIDSLFLTLAADDDGLVYDSSTCIPGFSGLTYKMWLCFFILALGASLNAQQWWADLSSLVFNEPFFVS